MLIIYAYPVVSESQEKIFMGKRKKMKVQLTFCNKRISIDSESIESIRDLDTYSNREVQAVITMKSGDKIKVSETYDEILRLMNEE